MFIEYYIGEMDIFTDVILSTKFIYYPIADKI